MKGISGKITAALICAAAWLLWMGGPAAPGSLQQMADPNFDARVANPAYTTNHPRLLFDEAHNNFHTASGSGQVPGRPADQRRIPDYAQPQKVRCQVAGGLRRSAGGERKVSWQGDGPRGDP